MSFEIRILKMSVSIGN